MVDAQFTEDEQVARLKSWWKENGTSVIVGVSIGLAAVVGYNWWESSAIRQAETASGLYEEMLIRQQSGDIASAEQMGSTLMDDYEDLPYGAMAGLFMARMSADEDDFASAQKQLEWVIENAASDGIRHTARLRLASVLLHLDKAADAKALVDREEMGGFESQYRELLGDSFVATKEFDAAREAYDASIESLPSTSSYREILTIKRDNLNQATQ